jgi:hypothetical protein
MNSSTSPQPQERNWQRVLIAALALLLFALGGVIYFIPSLDEGGALAGMTWKVAMVMGLGWLASPQLERLGWQRVRGTMLIAIVIVLVLYALRPRIGAIAAIILVAISALAAVGGWVRKLSRHS